MKIKKQINKEYEDCNVIEQIQIQAGIAKSIDVPTATRVASTLVPEQARTSLQDVVALDTFLKSIYTHFSKALTVDLNFLKASRYGTIRPAYGTESTVNRAITNAGNKLTLQAMQSNYFMPDNILQENLDNPNYETTVNNILIKAASDDLAELAFLGTTDTPSGTPGTSAYMYTLQTGFLTLLAADTTVVDATYQNTDIVGLLKTMKSAMKPEYANVGDNTFYLSIADYDTYLDQLSSQNASGGAYNVKKNDYFGIPIVAVPFLESKAIYTSASNFVIAFNLNGMSIETERRARMAGTDIILNYQSDFGYFVGEQIVYAS